VVALVTGLPAIGQELTWTACGEDSPHADAECARVALPLDYDDPTVGTVDVAVGRLRGTTPDGEARTQFWYLPGGPGDSGIETLDRLHDIFGDLGIDIYSLDHRGVGGTALLRCPVQETEDSEEGRELSSAEWPACVEWLSANRDDLNYLTATAAAQDLGAVIDLTMGADDRVIIFGASYGTYWANRYLTMFPEQPDGVILDGIVPADWTFAEFDSSLDKTARNLLDRCARSTECASHLGPDPIALAEDLPDRFDDGHCPDLSNEVDGRTLRILFGNMLMSGPEIWPHIPALIYRMNRCKVRDLEAAGALFETLFESGEGGEPESHSPVLQRHVAMSELWPSTPPAPDDLEAAISRYPMTTGVSASFATTYDGWPRYPRPALAGVTADYAGPMLLLHGGLDPTMPVERLDDLIDHFSGPGQQFVLFPDAGHVTLNENPCARSMYTSFIASPGTPVDRTCLATAPTVSFAPPETDAPLFGTEDFWGESATSLEIGVIVINILIAAAMAGIVLWVARWMRRRRARNAQA
jgi:pimeloyl-ACP methyl ester carboxylesterase